MVTYVDPEPCAGRLDEVQIERWRTSGFVLVDGLVGKELLAELTAAAGARFPAPGSVEAAEVSDFGSGSAGTGKPMTFPDSVDAFNRLTLDPGLLGAIALLLDEPICDLRLTQSDLWPKYGRSDRPGGAHDNQDQRIHVDYPNHTLVHPAPWDRPEAVEVIVYLSDHEDCGGSTAVVPRAGRDDSAYRWPIVDSPGIGTLDWVNDRASAEAYLAVVSPEVAAWRESLYEREVHTRFGLGSVLLYRHDTWHRGTPLLPGSRRLAHNLTYRRAECEWISTLHTGWSWAMYRRGQPMERLIADASVDQRAVLGFPKPGSSYWVPETVEAVGARYGPLGMDMSPYADGVT